MECPQARNAPRGTVSNRHSPAPPRAGILHPPDAVPGPCPHAAMTDRTILDWMSAPASASLWSLEGLRGAEPVLGLAVVMLVAVVAADLLHRWVRLPRACGWMLVGALASPLALRLLDRSELDPWKPLIDLAIGVLVFELGSRIRPRWLIDNRWLALSCLLEGTLAGLLVLFALKLLGVPTLSAAIAGAVAMSTSPIITLAVVHEARPRGQVTERLLLMSAVNSVLAMLAIKGLRVMAVGDSDDLLAVAGNSLYVVCGSFLLGAAAGYALHRLGHLLRGSAGAMPVLQIVLIVLATLLAARWTLSPLLALLVAGMMARRWLGHRLTVEPHFGTAGASLTVLLFMSLGLLFTFDQLLASLGMVLAIVLARLAGKAAAVYATARASGLGWRQAGALTVALQPMTSLAVLLAADTFGWPSQLPGLEATVLQALLVATTLLQLTGPLWTTLALRPLAREADEGDSRHVAG